MYTRYTPYIHHMYTTYTPNTPLNTIKYTPYIHHYMVGTWNVDIHCLLTKGENCDKKFCKHRYYESWSCCGSTDFLSQHCAKHVKKYNPARNVKKDEAKKRLKEVQVRCMCTMFKIGNADQACAPWFDRMRSHMAILTCRILSSSLPPSLCLLNIAWSTHMPLVYVLLCVCPCGESG